MVSIISNASNISNKTENQVKFCKNGGAYIRGNTVFDFIHYIRCPLLFVSIAPAICDENSHGAQYKVDSRLIEDDNSHRVQNGFTSE